MAAAGNSTKDHSISNSYPCDYDSPNIICVAATDSTDSLAYFSDIGKSHVDIGAPGQSIYSSIAHESIINESFDNVVAPALPTGWVVGGTKPKWITRLLGEPFTNVLFSDSDRMPYTNNVDSHITSQKINLKQGNSTISFLTACDTEYTITDSWDRMELQMSADGINFQPISFPKIPGYAFEWNEQVLDLLNGDISPIDASQFYFHDIPIDSKFYTENMKMRFLWKTNGSDDMYNGCIIEDISILHYTDGVTNKYEFEQGTSMATPHVVGMAGLVWGYKPDLTTEQMKSIILETGDPLKSLEGKTVTGKRINAQNAMIKAGEIENPTITNTPTPLSSTVVSPALSVTPSKQPTSTIIPSIIPTVSIISSIAPTLNVSEVGENMIVCGPADLDGYGRFSLYDFSNFAKKYRKNCSDRKAVYGSCGGVDFDDDGVSSIVDFSSFAHRYYPALSAQLSLKMRQNC